MNAATYVPGKGVTRNSNRSAGPLNGEVNPGGKSARKALDNLGRTPDPSTAELEAIRQQVIEQAQKLGMSIAMPEQQSEPEQPTIPTLLQLLETGDIMDTVMSLYTIQDLLDKDNKEFILLTGWSDSDLLTLPLPVQKCFTVARHANHLVLICLRGYLKHYKPIPTINGRSLHNIGWIIRRNGEEQNIPIELVENDQRTDLVFIGMEYQNAEPIVSTAEQYPAETPDATTESAPKSRRGKSKTATETPETTENSQS